MKATALLALLFALAANAANYSARQATVDTVEVVLLADAARKTEVTILPSIGNMGYEMKVNGKNVLYVPEGGLAKFKARPQLSGIPFLAPWGNRLDQQAFFANGKKYIFNMTLGNVRGTIPSHGFLSTSSAWKVAEVKADAKSAWVTSRLEFWKYPDMMAQFPFAHTIEMTYRLQEGVLQVETVLRNQSTEPMPVAIAFHPYFRLAESERDKDRQQGSDPEQHRCQVVDGAGRVGVLEPGHMPDQQQRRLCAEQERDRLPRVRVLLAERSFPHGRGHHLDLPSRRPRTDCSLSRPARTRRSSPASPGSGSDSARPRRPGCGPGVIASRFCLL